MKIINKSMKKKTTIAALILFFLGSIYLVYAANSNVKADKDLVNEWKALGNKGDTELTALVNNYLLEEIAKDKQEQMQQEYTDIGFYISNTYDQGQITEMNRIYNCVFN